MPRKMDMSGVQFVFRAEPSGDSYDVIRAIHGSNQSWIMMTYDNLAEAAYLVQTLQMLEIWRELRQRRQERAINNPKRT